MRKKLSLQQHAAEHAASIKMQHELISHLKQAVEHAENKYQDSNSVDEEQIQQFEAEVENRPAVPLSILRQNLGRPSNQTRDITNATSLSRKLPSSTSEMTKSTSISDSTSQSSFSNQESKNSFWDTFFGSKENRDAQNDTPTKLLQQSFPAMSGSPFHKSKVGYKHDKSKQANKAPKKLNDKAQLTLNPNGKDAFSFNCPAGVVFDELNRNILVADGSNHRIQVLNEQGVHVSHFGTRGDGQVQFQFPEQISLHPANNVLFVADRDNGRVEILTTTGQHITSINQTDAASPLSFPTSVSISDDVRHHVVVGENANLMHLYSEDDSVGYVHMRSFCHSSPFFTKRDQTNGVYGVCFDDDHQRILICDWKSGRLSVWSSDGSQFLKTIDLPDRAQPLSVHVDRYLPNRFVVGTGQNKVLVYDSRTDSVMQTIGSAHASSNNKEPMFGGSVSGLWINQQGKLLASDYNSNRVHVF